MTPRGWVGDDVVDLAETGFRDASRRERFTRRVCTGEELRWVEGAPTSTIRHVRLFTVWAAKEAAYKAFMKACDRGLERMKHVHAFGFATKQHRMASVLLYRVAQLMDVHRIGDDPT